MVRKEAIAIHRANIDPLILYGYKSADESFTVNDNDPDLKSVTISLPEPPDWSLIDGWGLEAKDQKFRKAVYPARLKELEDKIIRSVEDNRASAKNEVVTVQRIIDEIWKQLEIKQNEYQDEIKWIEKQWYFILYGYWVFINGKPTFIDGWHYRFLNFWDLTDATTEYRDRDRRFFHFQRYAFESTEDAFGKEMGHRTIYGTTYPKHRRDGATHKFLNIVYGITSITQGSLIGGIQSFDDDNASEQYRNKLLPAFKAMPFFLKPIWKGTQAPQAELSFTRVDNKIGDELGSRINFATTAFRKFYDGKKLISIILDEEGKCLGFRTLVKMADGTNKEVQDIVVGDQLMGDDLLPRNVLSTTEGTASMYRVSPEGWEPWYCNGPHILVLKTSSGIIEITVNQFIQKYGLRPNLNFKLYKADSGEETTFSLSYSYTGKYYGFTIDGNRRFLLGDYTVTHNTKSENIFERWDVIKQTLSQGSGSSIHGFAAHPTTVADMDEGGGKNYYDLNEGSKFYERNLKSGQTKTGLIRLFIPATDGLENFVGPYGESIIDTPTEEQAEFIGRDYGAKEYLQSQLDEFVRIGTPDAMQSYRNLKGLFPTQYADCFRTAKGDTGFDIDKLDKAIEKLRRDSLDEINPPTVRGDFKYIIATEPNPYSAKEYWELELYKKYPSPRVEWFPSKDGRWDVSEILEASRSNLKVQESGEFFPMHPFRYTAGADPFQFLDKGNSQKREDRARWSKGGGSIFRERDFDIDPAYKDIKDWTTNCFVATYENRPETDDEYAEEMLMACIYYGAEMYCEQNIRLVWKHFIKRKHGGYLKYQVDETTNRPKEHPGFFSLQNSKQQLFNAVKTYIKWHIHREKHLKFIEQCRAIKGVEYMTDFDLFTGCGAALLGSQIVRFEVDAEESNTDTEIGDIMPTFIYR